MSDEKEISFFSAVLCAFKSAMFNAKLWVSEVLIKCCVLFISMELFSQTCFTYLYWSVPGALRLKNTSHMRGVRIEPSEKPGADDRNGGMESDQSLLGLSVIARKDCLFNYVILDYFVCLACVTLKNKI